MVVREVGVAALSALGHVTQGGHRAGVVVVTLDAPSRDGAVVHGPAKGEVRLHVEFQVVNDWPLAAPAVLACLAIQDELVQQREPVTRRRLRVRTIGPKFGDDAAVVAAWHHVGCVGLAGEWVHLVALPPEVSVLVVPIDQTAVFPCIEVRQVVVRRNGPVVPERSRTDVPHHPVVGVQVLAPAQHHPKVPLPGILKPHVLRGVQVHGWSWVVPNLVGATVAFQHGQVGVSKRKPSHVAPLGPQERRGFRQELPALIDREAQLHGLPEVGVLLPARARHFRQDVGLGLLVAQVGVVVRFVGAIRHAVRNQLLGEVVAQGRGAVGGVVGGVERRVKFLEHHLRVDVVHRGLCLGAVHVAVANQPVGGVGHGHFLGLLAILQIAWHLQRVLLEGAQESIVRLAQKHRLGLGGIVSRPAVVHQDAGVVEVPGMHGRAGEIVANRFKQLFVPLVRHRGLGRRRHRHHHRQSQKGPCLLNQSFHRRWLGGRHGPHH